MAKYIIRLDYVGCGSEYYLGSKYTFKGERYPTIGCMQEAKRYQSRSRAENAAKPLVYLAGGIKGYEVVKVDG